MTFLEAAEWYLKTHSPTKRTAYIDHGRLKLAVRFFGNKRLAEIEPEEVSEFLDKLPELRTRETPRLKVLSDNTRNHYLVLLRGVYNRLKKNGKYGGFNPASAVELKKVPRARVRWLYPAEEKALSPIVAQDRELWPYYFLALHTGMRIGELRAMRVKDVDQIQGHIFVPNAKNHKSRYVYMSPNVSEYMKTLTLAKVSDEKLLPNWSYTFLRGRFQNACRAVGIGNLKIHDMRHTFAQRLLARGESIYLVSKLLGHSSVGVTQEHYGHLAASDMAKVVSKIDGIINPASVVPVKCQRPKLAEEADAGIESLNQ